MRPKLKAIAPSPEIRRFRWLDASEGRPGAGGPAAHSENAYLAVAREWGESVESGDLYALGHCGRVAENSVAVAATLGLAERDQIAIYVGAYLHDLGKVRLPKGIRNKPGSLSEEEVKLVRMLPAWGAEILANVTLPWDVRPIVRWHYERYDGSGYPDRLRGDDIPVAAQIVGITNVYDALTAVRPYRAALSHEQALEELTACRAWWSGRVFEACRLALLAAYGAPPLRLS